MDLYLVTGTGDFPALDGEPTQLWIQRMIGAGSTGCVYEAKLDANGQISQSYAIKVVKKGDSEKAGGRISRMYKEVEIYRILEGARASGREVDVPCCYGLYETKSSLFLVMDYVGEAVPGLELNEMKYTDK